MPLDGLATLEDILRMRPRRLPRLIDDGLPGLDATDDAADDYAPTRARARAAEPGGGLSGLPTLPSLGELRSWAPQDERPAQRSRRFESLAERGPEALEESIRQSLRDAPPESVAENPRAWWQTALEVLDLPRNAVANLVAKLAGVRPSSKEEFAGLQKIYASDFLQAGGWHPDSLAGKAAQFLVGLSLDFATDPITWLTLGASGTVKAGSRLLGAGGKIAETAEEVARTAKAAQELGKGVTFGRRLDQAGNVLREAVHVRPEALPKLVDLAALEEQQGRAAQALRAASGLDPAAQAAAESTPLLTPKPLVVPGTPEASAMEQAARADSLSAVERALQGLEAADVYSGRRGVGIGTHALRTVPLGHLVAGPAVLAGKAVGTLGELGGRVLGQIPVVGPLAGGALELAGKAVQAPLDLVGRASDWLGTPFRALPEANAFIPFRDIPGVGGALSAVEESLSRAASSQTGRAAVKAGRAVADAAAQGLRAIGIGQPTSLELLARQYLQRAERGVREDEATFARQWRPAIEAAAEQSGIPAERIGPLLASLKEHEGLVRTAAESGEPERLRSAVGDMREAAGALLEGSGVSPDRIMAATDDVVRAALPKETRQAIEAARVEAPPAAEASGPTGGGGVAPAAPSAAEAAAQRADELARAPRKAMLDLSDKYRDLVFGDEIDEYRGDPDAGYWTEPGQPVAKENDVNRPGYTVSKRDTYRTLIDQLPADRADLRMKVRLKEGSTQTDQDIVERIGVEKAAENIVRYAGESENARIDQTADWIRKNWENLGQEGLDALAQVKRYEAGVRKAPQRIEASALKDGDVLAIGDGPYRVTREGDQVTLVGAALHTTDQIRIPASFQIPIDPGSLNSAALRSPEQARADLIAGNLASWQARGAGTSPASILRWARSNLEPEQRQSLFGVAKITARDNRTQAENLVRLALARAGRGGLAGGASWESVFARLEHLEKVGLNEPAGRGLGARDLAAFEPYTRRNEGGAAIGLSDLGRDALDAMRALMRHGDHPELGQRLAREVADLELRLRRAGERGDPFPASERARLSVKKTVLKRLPARVEDDPAFTGAAAAAEAPPVLPGALPAGPLKLRPPDPEELFSRPIADVLQKMIDLEAQTRAAEAERGVGTADIRRTTQRGLGYFPRVLGGGDSFVGRLIRSGGMRWQQALRGMEEPGRLPATTKSAYDHLADVVARENTARAMAGQPPLPLPARDAPLSDAIAAILNEHPDLTPAHANQLRRQFLRESTIQELNLLAEDTGIQFETDPTRAWLKRRYGSHFAQAGADFLKAALEDGLKQGTVVKVAPKGPTPEGFVRVTDDRLGHLAKGYAVSEDIAKELARFAKHTQDPGPILKAFDWVTNKFKTVALSAAPYTMTNLLSGVFQANQFNAFSHKAWGAAKELMEAVHAGGGERLNTPLRELIGDLPEGVRDLSVGQFYDAMSIEHGALGKGFYGSELESDVGEAVRRKWDVAAALRSPFEERASRQRLAGQSGAAAATRRAAAVPVDAAKAFFRAFRTTNNAVEDAMKIGFVLERMRRGDDMATAVGKARLALNQSADLTDFEKATFRRVIPFWGWMKGNALLQFGMAMARPQMTAAVEKIRGNLESSFAGQEQLPPSLRPQHVAGELGAQIESGAKPDFYNLTRVYPVKELGLTPLAGPNLVRAAIDNVLQGLNPIIKMPVESAINRDLYFDRPITEYAGQRKSFLGVPLSPEQKRVAALVRPLNAVQQQSWRGPPQDLEEGAQWAGQALGLRVFPVDVARQVYDQERRINEQLGAVMRDYSRARDRATQAGRDWRSDEETQRLAGLYAELVDARERLPLKSLREANAAALRERREQRKQLREFALRQ